DEHSRREGPLSGIAGANAADRKREHRRHPISGIVERPPEVLGGATEYVDGLRRNFEVLCTVARELKTVGIPTHLPGVPRAVHQSRDRFPFPGFPVGRRMDRASRGPLAVAVPLEDVHLAVRLRILVDCPERRPQAGEQAVQLYPGLPGSSDVAPPIAAQLAAEVLIVFFG